VKIALLGQSVINPNWKSLISESFKTSLLNSIRDEEWRNSLEVFSTRVEMACSKYKINYPEFLESKYPMDPLYFSLDRSIQESTYESHMLLTAAQSDIIVFYDDESLSSTKESLLDKLNDASTVFVVWLPADENLRNEDIEEPGMILINGNHESLISVLLHLCVKSEME